MIDFFPVEMCGEAKPSVQRSPSSSAIRMIHVANEHLCKCGLMCFFANKKQRDHGDSEGKNDILQISANQSMN